MLVNMLGLEDEGEEDTDDKSSDEDDDYGFSNVKKKVVKDPRTRTLRHTVTPLLATKGLIISNMTWPRIWI